ncbi:hypothetical protein VST7929_02774 [Vibrio stylophorae]|uniref:Uncharacterized protein n=1 Tax=Vibrio stylophorae TaxID=659351 RepID=A0ABN8DVK6_9VIBR|nr:hypothetical protein [Vibrio stylophorae]CAH0535113.1 hypothetical protein VST7929_02774 [Vibrio stylophorae]
MKNKVLGAIAMIWGALILMNFFTHLHEMTSGAYSTGKMAGVIFGCLLLAAGIHTFFFRKAAAKNTTQHDEPSR